MRKAPSSWDFLPEDVQVYGSSGTCGPRKAGQSRATNITSMERNLLHTPTGVEVKGEIPHGHYSRKEMRKLEEALIENLLERLENKVAEKLRIPGR